jgi:hypothetical protein
MITTRKEMIEVLMDELEMCYPEDDPKEYREELQKMTDVELVVYYKDQHDGDREGEGLRNEKGGATVKALIFGIWVIVWVALAANYSGVSVASSIQTRNAQIEQLLEAK